ncbi:MAG: Hsp33 family molecular chaperone [Alphaproteobacteria bacterium]|nr:Hsp33 family molecular chaperone [Alphaproteobacteria bacterium]
MVAVDDVVQPFQIEGLDVRGRIVRLGAALDDILRPRDYPPPVARLLGEAVVLASLLGSALKFEGRFILQAQTDGAVSFLVVDYRTPGHLRAYARYDQAKIEAEPNATPASLLGRGHLAMTIDPGAEKSRYQGMVALEGEGLEQAAHEYFLRSEQIPTRVRLSVGAEWRAGEGRSRWRGGGMLLQYLPAASPQAQSAGGTGAEDAWNEARSLINTVSDVELLDPELSGERLLLRLFHERGVRVLAESAVTARCSCSREAVCAMLAGFSPSDRADMVKDSAVEVNCEFCGSSYRFTPQELGLPV